MRQLVPLFSRRVPIYISLPVIVACAAAGYVISNLQAGGRVTGAAPVQRAAVPDQSPVAATQAAAPATSEKQLSPKLPLPSNVVVLPPTDEVNPPVAPAPAREIVEPNVHAADAAAKAPPSVLATKPERRPRATRPTRSAAKARRPQQAAQQPAAPTGLNSIPVIGPAFSLLQ